MSVRQRQKIQKLLRQKLKDIQEHENALSAGKIKNTRFAESCSAFFVCFSKIHSALTLNNNLRFGIIVACAALRASIVSDKIIISRQIDKDIYETRI